MTGQALPNGRGRASSTEAVTPLAFFACILLGADADDPSVVAACRVARTSSSETIRAGRAPVTSAPWLAYQTLYRAVRSRAASVRSMPAPAQAIIGSLGRARHRQRAALTLRHVIGLEAEHVAAVIGVRVNELDRLMQGAEAAVAKAHGAPVDVPAALRQVGSRVVASAPPTRAAGRAPSRLPRRVVRQILAPPLDAPPAPATPASGLQLHDVPPRKVPSPGESSGTQRAPWARLAYTLAFGALIAAMVFPVSAGVRPRSAPLLPATNATAPPPQDAVAPAVVPPPSAPTPRAASVVVVRSGDSLWAIAERALGDPYRWTEIWATNRGATMRGSERFSDADLIRPGWRLVLPRRR